MLELTLEQHQALRQTTRGKLRARDPQTGDVYVLVREDDFDRMQQVASGLTREMRWQPAQEGIEPGRATNISETLSQVFRDQGAWLLEFADLSRSVAAPLSFQGRVNVDDLYHITRYQGLLKMGKPMRWILKGLFLCLPAGGLLAAFLNPNPPVARLWFWLLLFLGLLLTFTPREQRRKVERQYREHENEYLESRVILTPDRVYTEDTAHRTDYLWKFVSLICNTPEGLMFCSGNECAFWLPQRLFEGNDLREQVLDLATRNGVKIRELS